MVAAASEALERWGFGMASVRFICGTQDLHAALEADLSAFLGTDDTILFSSCFDANGGVFETLFGAEDAIISDELNHASLIDGIRLCKAARYRYKNADMADLEAQLVAAKDARTRCIVTDGVFSMDGYLAPLDAICDLAEKHDALVLVDDSHAVGFVGPTGRGTPEHFGVTDRVDIVTGTLGKALGGASGGYVAGRTEIVDLLRQRARPYLFSNAVAPSVAAGSQVALRIAGESTEARETPASQHRAVPLADDRGGLRDPRRRAPDHAGDVPRRRRRARGLAGRRRDARAGRLRHRVLLPGRPARPGPDPGAALRGALRGRRTPLRRRLPDRNRPRCDTGRAVAGPTEEARAHPTGCGQRPWLTSVDGVAIRLALVNDYEVVVRGLSSMLRNYADDFTIVELNANTEVSEPVDIALFDVFAQSSGDGEDVHDLLANPIVRQVVVYAWHVTPAMARRAMENGVSGYVSKTLPAHELVQALHAVHAGGKVVSGSSSKRSAVGGDWPGREEGLTAREAEVIALITQGLSNSDIAAHSSLSINSVKSYIRSAYRKIGVTSRTNAVLWGVEHGFHPDRARIDGPRRRGRAVSGHQTSSPHNLYRSKAGSQHGREPGRKEHPWSSLV